MCIIFRKNKYNVKCYNAIDVLFRYVIINLMLQSLTKRHITIMDLRDTFYLAYLAEVIQMQGYLRAVPVYQQTTQKDT